MNVCLQNIAQAMEDIRQAAGFFIEMNLAALNVAHVQYIIDQT